MGGQVGDIGSIGNFEVTNTVSPFTGIIGHEGLLKKGSLFKKEKVVARVNAEARIRTQNNHTATHLLHWALQKVLGDHVKQAGSLVEPKRLRFDFAHHKALTEEDILQIENRVNEKIRENKPVQSYTLTLEEATKKSEIKQFFGEKYGSKVRVIDIDFSKELCGGTHTSACGTIGFFKIVKEGSIAQGVRRIEAVTGVDALDAVREKETELLDKVKQLQEEIKQKDKKLQEQHEHSLKHVAETLLKEKEPVKGFQLLTKKVDLDASVYPNTCRSAVPKRAEADPDACWQRAAADTAQRRGRKAGSKPTRCSKPLGR